jgi:hypothetical protein
MSLHHPVSIRFPEPLLEELSKRARAERRSLSNLVRVLVETALDPAVSSHDPRQKR